MEQWWRCGKNGILNFRNFGGRKQLFQAGGILHTVEAAGGNRNYAM
jgi:hypothetical protein